MHLPNCNQFNVCSTLESDHNTKLQVQAIDTINGTGESELTGEPALICRNYKQLCYTTVLLTLRSESVYRAKHIGTVGLPGQHRLNKHDIELTTSNIYNTTKSLVRPVRQLSSDSPVQ